MAKSSKAPMFGKGSMPMKTSDSKSGGKMPMPTKMKGGKC